MKRRKSVSFVCVVPNKLPLQRTNGRKNFFVIVCHCKPNTRSRGSRSYIYVFVHFSTLNRTKCRALLLLHMENSLVHIYWLLDEKSYCCARIKQTQVVRRETFITYIFRKWMKSYNCSGFQMKFILLHDSPWRKKREEKKRNLFLEFELRIFFILHT